MFETLPPSAQQNHRNYNTFILMLNQCSLFSCCYSYDDPMMLQGPTFSSRQQISGRQQLSIAVSTFPFVLEDRADTEPTPLISSPGPRLECFEHKIILSLARSHKPKKMTHQPTRANLEQYRQLGFTLHLPQQTQSNSTTPNSNISPQNPSKPQIASNRLGRTQTGPPSAASPPSPSLDSILSILRQSACSATPADLSGGVVWCRAVHSAKWLSADQPPPHNSSLTAVSSCSWQSLRARLPSSGPLRPCAWLEGKITQFEGCSRSSG